MLGYSHMEGFYGFIGFSIIILVVKCYFFHIYLHYTKATCQFIVVFFLFSFSPRPKEEATVNTLIVVLTPSTPPPPSPSSPVTLAYQCRAVVCEEIPNI